MIQLPEGVRRAIKDDFDEREAERYRAEADAKLKRLQDTPMVQLGPDTPLPNTPLKRPDYMRKGGYDTPDLEQPSTPTQAIVPQEGDPLFGQFEQDRQYSALGPSPMLTQSDLQGDPQGDMGFAVNGTGGPEGGSLSEAQIIDIRKRLDERVQAAGTATTRSRLMQGANPDEAAADIDLADKTGVNRVQVEQNRKTYQAVERAKQIDELRTTAPKLRAWIDFNPEHLDVAHDDTQNLGWWEQTGQFLDRVAGAVHQLDTMSRDAPGAVFSDKGIVAAKEVGAFAPKAGAALGSGYVKISEGIYGIPRAAVEINDQFANWISGKTGQSDVSKWLGERQAAAKQIADSLMPKSDDPTERGVLQGFQSLPTSAVAAIVGVMSQGAVPALFAMGGVTGGQSYGEARAQGLNPISSAGYGMGQGLIEAGTEALPMQWLIGDVAKRTPFFEMLTKQALGEGVTEQVATHSQDFLSWAVLPESRDKPISVYLAERGPAAYETLVATMVGTGVQTAIAKSVDMSLQAIDEGHQDRRSQMLAKTFDAMAQGAADSKLLKRLPDKYREAVATVTKDGPLENVRVAPEAFNELAQSAGVTTDQLAQAFRIDPNDMNVAIDSGDYVVIPAGNYAAALATAKKEIGVSGDTIHSVFAPNMKFNDKDLTAREWEARKQVIAEEEAARKQDESGTVFADAADRVRENIRQRVAGTKIWSRSTSAVQATLASEIAITTAARLGEDPEKFWNDMGFGVSTQFDPGAEGLPQRAGRGMSETQAKIVELRARRVKPAEIARRVYPDKPEKQGRYSVYQALTTYRSAIDELRTQYDVENPQAVQEDTQGSDNPLGIPRFKRGYEPVDIITMTNDGLTDDEMAAELTFDSDTDLSGNAIATQATAVRQFLREAQAAGKLEEVGKEMRVTPDELVAFIESTTRKNKERLADHTKRIIDLKARGLNNRQIAEAIFPDRETDKAVNIVKVQASKHKDAVEARRKELAQAGRRGDFSGHDLNADPIIRLFETANLSTFVHEVSHWYLTTLEKMARSENPHPFIVSQLAAIREWAGKHPEFEMYDENGRITPEGREVQEKFAETFELHLREGTAPTSALRSVFASIKAWLLSIYKKVAGGYVNRDNGAPALQRAQLNPEITEVFNRMLATDEAINAVHTGMARDGKAMAEAIIAKTGENWSDARKAKFTERMQARYAAAREEAENALYERLIQEYRRQRGAVRRDEERGVRREVASEIDEQPAMRAYAWLSGQGYRDTLESHVETAAAEAEAMLELAQADGYAGTNFIEAAEWLSARAKGLDMAPEARAARAKSMGFTKRFYHETKASPEQLAEGFDTTRRQAATGDSVMPIGVFVKPGEGSIGIGGTQVELLVRLGNTRTFEDRAALESHLRQDPEYAAMADGIKAINDEYRAKTDEAEAIWHRMDRTDPDWLRQNDRVMAILKEWETKEAAAGEEARIRATEILKAEGLNSITVTKDVGSFKRAVKTTVVLDPKDIRSPEAAFDPDEAASARLLAQGDGSAGLIDPAHIVESATDESLAALKARMIADGRVPLILLFRTSTGRVIAFPGPNGSYGLHHDQARDYLGLGELKLEHGIYNPRKWPNLSDMNGPDAWYDTTGSQADAFDMTPDGYERTAEFGSATLKYAVNPDRTMSLEVIEVPPAFRGQGEAGRALDKLLAEADANELTVYLEPEPIGKDGMTKPQLEAFYARRGFTRQAGGTGMVRSPNALDGLAQLAGKRSTGYPADQEATATALEASGASVETIWKETGMFRSADGKWRYEIDDSQAKLTAKLDEIKALGDETVALSEVLKHPDLFKAYPELADIRVHFEYNDTQGGAWNAVLNEIEVSISTKQNMLSVILHEVQHVIQDIEGFATGGAFHQAPVINPRWKAFQKKIKENPELASFLRDRDAMASELDAADAYLRELATAANDLLRESFYEDDLARAEQMQAEVEDLYKEAGRKVREKYPEAVALWRRQRALVESGMFQNGEPQKYLSGRDVYFALAGEVEARNVQTRHKMPLDDKLVRSPAMTQDRFNADIQIVRFSSYRRFGGNALAQSGQLDMSASARMQRAKEQGFTIDAYHGTAEDISQFGVPPPFRAGMRNDNAIFLTAEPDLANSYAMNKGRRGTPDENMPGLFTKSPDRYREGANVMPVKVRLRNPLVFDAKGQVWSRVWPDAMVAAKRGGHDGVIMKNVDDWGDGIMGREARSTTDKLLGRERAPRTVYAVFDANNVRSKFAAFDPAEDLSSRLLAQSQRTTGRTAPPPDLPPMRLDLRAVEEQYGPEALAALPPRVRAYSANATDADQYLQLARDVRKSLTKKHPKSLWKFLSTQRRIGSGNDRIAFAGIRDDGGEILKIIGEKKAAPGLINNREDAKRVRAYTIHDASVAAWEAGYFSGESPLDDAAFLDALRADFDGTAKLYARDDIPIVQELKNAEQQEAWFDENGIDINEKDDAVLKARLEEVLSSNVGNAISPDEAAAFFKMRDGNELLQGLAQGPKRNQLIREETKRRMLARHGDPFRDGTIMREAEVFARNEIQQRQMEIELEALAKAAGQQTATNLAKQTAIENLRTKQIREVLNYDQWRILEQRWAKKALEAAQKGDMEKAATYAKYRLLNAAMFVEGRKLAEKIEKERKGLIDYGSKSKQARLYAAGADYAANMNGLLDDYQLRNETRKSENKRAERAAWIQQQMAGIDPWAAYQDTTKTPAEQQIAAAEQLEKSRTLSRLSEGVDTTNYKSMTVEDFMAVRDEADLIWRLATLKDKLLKAGERRRLTLAAEDIAASIVANKPKAREPEAIESGLPKEKRKRTLGGILAAHRTFQSLAREMDGGKNGGVVWRYLVKPLNEAFAHKSTLMKQAGKDVAKLFEVFSSKEISRFSKDRQTLTLTAADGSKATITLTTQGRLAVGLNAGNAKNRQRLMDSNGWDEAQLQQILDTLDKRSWDWIQSVWNYLDTWFPEANRVHEAVHGAPMDKEPALPIATRFGIYAGGYFPIRYDPNRSSKSGQRALEKDSQAAGAGRVGVRTKEGFTKKRVSGRVTLPLNLDPFMVILSHLDEVTTSIATEEALFDVGRLAMRKEVEDAIVERHGRARYNEIIEVLKAAKFGLQGPRGAIEAVMNHVRNGSTVAKLGWNLTTALLQPAGVSNSIVRVGSTWMLRGYARMMGSAVKMQGWAKWTMEQSEFMRHRRDHQSPEQVNLLATLKGNKPLVVAQRSVYWLMAQTQFLSVDVPTWLGMYERAKAEGADHADAVAQADQAVIDAQGGGEAFQTAGIQRGSVPMRLWTNLMSYMLTTYSLSAASLAKSDPNAVAKVARLTGDMILLWSVPVAATMAIRAIVQGALSGGGGDDDDETWTPENIAREQAAFLLSPYFGLSQLSGALKLDPFEYRGPAGGDIITQGYKALDAASHGKPAELLRPANQVAGMIFHLPANQIDKSVRGALALWNGETTNPAAIFFGPPPKN